MREIYLVCHCRRCVLLGWDMGLKSFCVFCAVGHVSEISVGVGMSCYYVCAVHI